MISVLRAASGPRSIAAVALLFLLAPACGGSGSGNTTPIGELTGNPGGFVTYLLGDEVFRLGTKADFPLVNVTSELDGVSGGTDESPAVSRNGEWLTLTTSRFGCSGTCLARVAGTLSAGELVNAGGDEVNPDGRAAISNDGNTVVFPLDGGPNDIDLWVTRRQGGNWTAPELLTGDSNDAYNDVPVLNEAADKVLFDCGPVPFSQNGTDICQVDIDGNNLEKLVDSNENPLGGGGDFLAHHGDYFSDGTIAFEADWSGGEQVWVLRPGASTPTVVDDQFSNDNSPCVLPGGYIASLWLGRDGGSGTHELKVMAPDASEFAVLTPDVDIADIGMSCHGPTD